MAMVGRGKVVSSKKWKKANSTDRERRINMKWLLTLFLALVFVGSVVVADPCCAAQITIGQGTDAATLDPHLTLTMSDINIINHVCEGLIQRDQDMKIIPDLAESWKVTDPLAYEFKLRRGVKFHNGEPFDANVVKFNIERILNPGFSSRIKPFLEAISKVEVVDDFTVRIITKKPSPVLLNELLNVLMLPPKYVKEKGDQYVTRNPVGTGPYRFVEWMKDSHITLQAYEQYWRGKPSFERLVFKPIPENSTRVAGLLAGELDIITNVPPSDINRLKAQKDVSLVLMPGTRCMFVKLNTEKPPFNNKWVRQALNYAVDKDALVDALFEGKARILNGQLLTPEYFGYNPKLKAYPYDPQKAKELLAKGGYPNGFEVEFDSPSGRYLLDTEVSQAIAGQLLKVGVKAKVSVLEWGLLMKKYVEAHNMAPMTFFGMAARSIDADGMYTFDLPGSPFTYYHNVERDRLVLEARATMDPQKRQKIYDEVSEIYREDAPFVFLYQQVDIYGVSKKCEWWKPRADTSIRIFQVPKT